MMQGDAYGLEIVLKKGDGTILTAGEVADVEITIGSLSKKLSDGGIVFNGSVWVFPLRQAETFNFPASRLKAQARIVWPGGDVEGVKLGDVRVDESLSREAL